MAIYTKGASRKWQTHLVVPLETLAGQDLLQIHTKHQETGIERRKTERAKLSSMCDVRPVVQPSNTPDASTSKPDPNEKPALADGHTADDDEKSRRLCDSSKPTDEATAAGEGGSETSDADKVTKQPLPQATDGEVADGPPNGPKQNAFCDSCANRELIIGRRWKCMVCEDYDLCDRCHSAGIHNEHQMLKIEHPDDAINVEAVPYNDDTNSVLLGFRVYSKSYAPVNIAGQLANGYTIGWKKND